MLRLQIVFQSHDDCCSWRYALVEGRLRFVLLLSMCSLHSVDGFLRFLEAGTGELDLRAKQKLLTEVTWRALFGFPFLRFLV